MNVGSTFSGVGGFDLGFERAGMSVDERLRDADITPTTDAAKAFRLGYEAARLDAADGRGKFATIIDRATTHVKP